MHSNTLASIQVVNTEQKMTKELKSNTWKQILKNHRYIQTHVVTEPPTMKKQM